MGIVFAVLLKYNALMALSGASLPFPLPANVALGLIMIAGAAASRALVVSMRPASHADLGIAWVLGFAPAALIGLPGLVGLAAAIAARIALLAYLRRKLPLDRRSAARPRATADRDLLLPGRARGPGVHLTAGSPCGGPAGTSQHPALGHHPAAGG